MMTPDCVRFRFGLLLMAFSLCSIDGAVAEGDLLPTETSISKAIDHYVDAKLVKEEITPSPQISDAAYLRRVTLDLAGRVPTLHEQAAYRDSTESDKKQKLIDRLLVSPDFAFHQRNRLDELLLAEIKKDNNWREYLLKSVQSDKPWDQMFREIILADGTDEETIAAQEFLASRIRDVNKMTNDTSKLFFGVSVNCAHCHDHPLVLEWKQDHYFGFASFFNRTYLTKSKRLAEKFEGDMQFRTTEGEEKTAEFMFLTGVKTEEPAEEVTDELKKERNEQIKKAQNDENAPVPEPEFSPRKEFVQLALANENQSFFAQSIVNRMWASLFGSGIIDPPDQNHSGNEPSHPQLLKWLERDLIAHNYDLKRLVGGIVASEAYARSSEWNGEGERPQKWFFAVSEVRPLTPRQYSLSLLISTTSPESIPMSVEDEKWADFRQRYENSAEGMADQLERPSEHFQVSVDEALLFSNNSRVENDYLRDSGDKLVGHLKKQEQQEEQIRLAIKSTLGREPDEGEAAAFLEYINERQDRPVDGLKQIVWALITSPEMRFNY
ncbi:MAG: DUF1549 domain-containing protein [Planctomycetaceae bacterium]|nr:DUF1549 domain-containing protein [Planctomycetaceae bacterium]